MPSTIGTLGAGGMLPPESPALWLDASRITGLANGASVTSWVDVSPNGWSASGGVSPTYQTNVLNGLPTVRFNGTTQYLTVPGGTGLAQNTVGITVFCICNPASQVPIQRLLYASLPSASSSRIALFRNGTTSFQGTARRLDADSLATLSSAIAATQQFDIFIYTVNYNTGAGNLWRNGTNLATNASFVSTGTTSNTASAVVHIGANNVPDQFLNGDIAELIVWRRELTTDMRKMAEQYANRKYGIAIAA